MRGRLLHWWCCSAVASYDVVVPFLGLCLCYIYWMLWQAKPFNSFQGTWQGGGGGDSVWGCREMLPPSSTKHLSEVVWLKRVQNLPMERWMFAENNICLDGARGVRQPSAATNGAPTLSNIKHTLNIELPRKAVHAQEILNHRRSSRPSHNPLSQELNITSNSNQEPSTWSARRVLSTNSWARVLAEMHMGIPIIVHLPF
jgi:hypothetical protein